MDSSEMGRKGGLKNSEAQRAARAQPKGGGRPRAPRDPANLYRLTGLPGQLFAWDAARGELVVFPMVPLGWFKRVAYSGEVRKLRPCRPDAANGTMWPHSPRKGANVPIGTLL